MRQLKACGVLCFRTRPQKQFLLMRRHSGGYDLPKGHVEEGETERVCALRELEEETGITAAQLTIDPDFRFTASYNPRYKRFKGEQVHKTVVIFLGQLNTEVEITLTEHKGFEWIDWEPGLKIEKRTVNDLLRSVEEFWDNNPHHRF